MGCFAIRWCSSTGSCFPLFDLGLTCLAPLRWPTSCCTLRGSALPSSVAFWVDWIPRLARHRWLGLGSKSSGSGSWRATLGPSLQCLPTGIQLCRPRRLGELPSRVLILRRRPRLCFFGWLGATARLSRWRMPRQLSFLASSRRREWLVAASTFSSLRLPRQSMPRFRLPSLPWCPWLIAPSQRSITSSLWRQTRCSRTWRTLVRRG